MSDVNDLIRRLELSSQSGSYGGCQGCDDTERQEAADALRASLSREAALVEAVKPFKQFCDGLSGAVIVSGGKMPDPSDVVIRGPGEGALGGRLEWQHFLTAAAALNSKPAA